MSSRELALSAADTKDVFLEQAFAGIEAARIEKKIQRHYYVQAHLLYKRVWRQCKRRTGHTYKDQSGFHDLRVCEHCGRPAGISADERERTGVNALAAKLRAADKKAGTEYVP